MHTVGALCCTSTERRLEWDVVREVGCLRRIRRGRSAGVLYQYASETRSNGPHLWCPQPKESHHRRHFLAPRRYHPSLGWASTRDGQDSSFPHVHELIFSNVIPHSMWDSTDGHPETPTGVINEWILHEALISLRMLLKESELVCQSHATERDFTDSKSLALSDSLLKHIIGTRNQATQHLPGA